MATQGIDVAEIITVGEPTCPDPAARIRIRILKLIGAGSPRVSWDPGRQELRFHGQWQIPPGVCPWWELRQRLGGRIDSRMLREAVDDLIAAGQLLEAWLAPSDRRTPPHVLLLPGHSAALRHPVARARGRANVLACEPWAATLSTARVK